MTAQVTYSGNPADWSGEVPPSRDEALLLAARAAAAAGDVMIPPEAAMARAAQSRAWSAVAALAGDAEAIYVKAAESMHEKTGWPTDRLLRMAAESSRSMVRCEHGQTVFWSGASWVHPLDMGTCDRPPGTDHA